MNLNNRKGFFSLLGTLISVAIICYLLYIASTKYFGQSSVTTAEEPAKQVIAEQGIDTSSQQSVLTSTTVKLKEMEKMRQEQADKMLEEMSGAGLNY